MPFDAVAALNHRLILIEGDYASERLRALEAIIAAAGLDEPDAFDRETVIASEKPFAEWVAAVETVPFMAERRCVVVRNVNRVSPEDASESLNLDCLKTLPESALLILVADDETKVKDDNSRAERASPWRKIVQASKGMVAIFTVKEGASSRSLPELAKASGKKLSPRTASLLTEMVAGRHDRAEEELHKLILFVGDAPEITPEHLKLSVSPEPEHNVFQMLDACWFGDARGALTQLHRLRDRSRDFDGEARRLLGLVASQLRVLWQARNSVEKASPEWEPEERNLTKMKDYPRRLALQTARRLDFPTLLECMEAVREANRLLTAGSQGVEPVEIVEQAVLKICQTARSRRSA
ncbi:MAG: DNA polymerase III subunit delta [Armatimonadetes bacterium]|nr:DNA polymerase III subunit delta [Armatimonadota bacterium]